MIKNKLCNWLIENSLVIENDVINHSYASNRMNNWDKRNVESNNISPTLTTRCDSLGVTVKDMDNLRIRKLTPKECWRLMGFDDCDVDICSNNGISDTQLYKQAGNSIVVNVLEAIFLEMQKADLF